MEHAEVREGTPESIRTPEGFPFLKLPKCLRALSKSASGHRVAARKMNAAPTNQPRLANRMVSPNSGRNVKSTPPRSW
jgi:hypothetical protein